MKIKEYNPLKRSIVAVIATMALFSCSDWTETESLNIKTPTLEEENPALYEAYISSLNEYKKSEHKVTIVKFDNKETDPAGQGERITALPDSIVRRVGPHARGLRCAPCRPHCVSEPRH